MPHSNAFSCRSLDQLASNNVRLDNPLLNSQRPTTSTPATLFSMSCVQQCPAQTPPPNACHPIRLPEQALLVARHPIRSPNFVGAICNMSAQQAPFNESRLQQKSRPINVERLSIKPCEVSTGLGFNHPKPSIKNVLGARFTQRPLRSRASQPWEQQPSSWADAAREPGWSRQPQPQSPGREQQPSWTG